MKEHELRNALKNAADGCQLSEYQKRHIVAKMKGEEPVKKKLTVSVVLVMVITLLTLSAAFALVHSTIVDQLFGSYETAPEEVTERIQTPQIKTETPLGVVSLDEWFYDGQSLHTAFSIANPTDEALFYTLDGINLNGQHVSYNRLRTEGAGDSGLLLGGTVNGTAMPASISLYNQGDTLDAFDENRKYTGMVPIPEGASDLEISIAVWKPVNPVELVDYKQYEGINITETKDHLTVDSSGFSQLWLFRPEEYNLAVYGNQSAAQIYQEAYQKLGWLELVDTITVKTSLLLSKEQAVRAIPEEMEFNHGSYRLVLEKFDFSHAGGALSIRFYGAAETLKELVKLPYGISLVDRENKRILSCACSWNPDFNEEDGMAVEMSLSPVTGDLPEVVYIAPAVSYTDELDPSSPYYNESMKAEENVIEGWEYDFSRAVAIPMRITH